MIGVLVATHGRFADGILEACEMFTGDKEKVCGIGLFPGEDVAIFSEKMKKKTEELDDGDGVLILVDLLGGSPGNCAFVLTKDRNIRCITGVNMPMLITALEAREYSTMDEIVEQCIQEGSGLVKELRCDEKL